MNHEKCNKKYNDKKCIVKNNDKIFCNLGPGYVFKAYLGLTYTDDNGNTQPITEQMFDEFVPIIAETFPDGFTIYDSEGGYQFQGQTFIEPSKVLEIILPKGYCEISNLPKGCCEISNLPKGDIIVQYKKFVELVRKYSIQFHQSSELYTVQELFFKAQSSSDSIDDCMTKCNFFHKIC